MIPQHIDSHLRVTLKILQETERRARVRDLNAVHALNDVAVLQADAVNEALWLNREQTKPLGIACCRSVWNSTSLREEFVEAIHRAVDLTTVNLETVLCHLTHPVLVVAFWGRRSSRNHGG